MVYPGCTVGSIYRVVYPWCTVGRHIPQGGVPGGVQGGIYLRVVYPGVLGRHVPQGGVYPGCRVYLKGAAPESRPLPVSLLASSLGMLRIVSSLGICRVPPSRYMPPSHLLVGVPASRLACRCPCVHTGEHELTRNDDSYSRVVDEERLSAP